MTEDYQRVLGLIQEEGGYVLCPGIQPAWYEDKHKAVGFQRENIRAFKFPRKRYESVNCLLWHKPCNRYTTVGDHVYNVCSQCKQEAWSTLQNANRNAKLDQSTKDARRNPSSKYPIANLPPSSRSRKVDRLKKENKANRDKLNKLLEKTSKLKPVITNS